MNEWSEPKTVVAIGSLFIGAMGLLFGVLSYRWNRHESRRETIARILENLVRAAQDLNEANALRRKIDGLGKSFPNPDIAMEATIRIRSGMEKYDELIKSSHRSVRDAEAAMVVSVKLRT
ncbi:hypothetical protein [Botrimarina colliarenosi]|uniref:hypothetical protein n=1 Tax=Botrimarina colliarenosi TaxID=2528001 RepID=UPI0011B71B62|nr:hypothetical protein [Botrimarina colliarenosi]